MQEMEKLKEKSRGEMNYAKEKRECRRYAMKQKKKWVRGDNL